MIYSNRDLVCGQSQVFIKGAVYAAPLIYDARYPCIREKILTFLRVGAFGYDEK